MDAIRAASTLVAHPVDVPLAPGATKGTTMGPATPAAPRWMCAPVAGSAIPETARSKHTVPALWFNTTSAYPLPAASAAGTSSRPLRAALSTAPPVRAGADVGVGVAGPLVAPGVPPDVVGPAGSDVAVDAVGGVAVAAGGVVPTVGVRLAVPGVGVIVFCPRATGADTGSAWSAMVATVAIVQRPSERLANMRHLPGAAFPTRSPGVYAEGSPVDFLCDRPILNRSGSTSPLPQRTLWPADSDTTLWVKCLAQGPLVMLSS